MSESQTYAGSELELFAEASQWKSYWGKLLNPYLCGSVLEVGAGNGTNASFLVPEASRVNRWVCVEPDSSLAEKIRDRQLKIPQGNAIEVRTGTIECVSKDELFDVVLYIDVLEHIEDDEAEVSRAAEHLRPGGHLLVLAPAHDFLFSPFDASIGHFRRYNKNSLQRSVPRSLQTLKLQYLDSVGLFASLANKTVMKQGMPTRNQILLWDRLMVRLSRAVDPLCGYKFGKSLIGVWKKSG